MPITQEMLPALLTANTHAGAEMGKAGLEAALRAYLQKQEPAMAGQTEQAQTTADLNVLKSPEATEMIKNGGSVQAGKMHFGADPYARNSVAADRMLQQKTEALSKRYEGINDFNSDLSKMETLTNIDGKGGILTNPDAQLKGTGEVASAIPTSALGLSEFFGKKLGIKGLEGMSETRKGLEQLQLSYARALGGARGVNPAMVQKEKEAMGYITSGDPELVKKGVLSLSENVKNHLNTIQGGYSPGVKQTVHGAMGGDPMDFYRKLPQKGPAGNPVGMATVSNPQQQQPQMKAPPPMFDFEAEDKRRAASKVQQSAQPQPQGQ